MSVSLNVRAYSGRENKEFQKHYNAVKFCIENELSFPEETSEFFKGKVNGDDLEDFDSGLLECLENGIEVPLKTTGSEWEVRIKVSEIPNEVDEIIITLS